MNIYEFTDYRAYLKSFYETKKAANPAYSMSTFTRKAGLGANSRGYLKLVIEGKRNLTPHTMRRFAEAIGLNGKESLYFENLVYFNQSRTSEDRQYYFHRLSAAASGKETPQIELLASQYRYFANWYYVAVRELVGLADFREDPAWIVANLRNKLTKREATEAIADLLTLGLIRRTEEGKLVQSEPAIKHTGGYFNPIIEKFQLQMMDRARESLTDDYSERNVSFVTLSCDYSALPEIKKAIDQFRDQLIVKHGLNPRNPDAVIQVNFQLFQLTPPKGKRSTKKGEAE